MSHILIRKLTSSRNKFAGKDWYYEFGAELNSLDENLVIKYIRKKQAQFAKLTKSWDDNLNTEWVCRIFFAAKMILTASLMLENLEYSKEKNLKICVPYLQYYSLLYSLRSLLFVLPEQKWNNSEFIRQTHKKTINVTCQEVSKIDPNWSNDVNERPPVIKQLLRLKAFRELLSYRAPSDGGRLEDYDKDILPLCRMPVEIAQMVSEILEESLRKNVPGSYKPTLIAEELTNVFETTIEDESFFDEEDYYRISYLIRKYPFPTNILHMISEGHVEDFFGSWCPNNDEDGVFNPDENWNILFNFP